MKKQKFNVLLLATIIGAAAVSCQKESVIKQDLSEASNEILLPDGRVEYLLRKGDPISQTERDYVTEDDNVSTKAVRDLTKHLGETYKLEAYPTASRENLGYLKVIDYDRYIQDHPDCYIEETYDCPNEQTNIISSFEEYEDIKNETDIVDVGGKINFVVFKLNAKYHYEKTFCTSESSQKKSIYGEFFKQWRHKGYFLDFISNIDSNPEFMAYVSKGFLDRIYTYPPQEFINKYGAFFLSKYETGSQISVLYEGVSSDNKSATSEDKKRALEVAISASIGKFSGDASYGQSNEDHSSTSNEEALSSIRFWINGNGSINGPTQSSTAQNLGSAAFDFTSWYESLKDTTGFDIIRLPKGALIPLTCFIEDNTIKNIFQKYYTTGTCLDNFYAPKLSLYVYDDAAGGYSHIDTELFSRYSDESTVLKKNIVVKTRELDKYIGEECARLAAICPYLDITCNRNLFQPNKKYVTIEIVRLPGKEKMDRITTTIGNFPGTGIVIKDVELDSRYVADYYEIERNRVKRLYPDKQIKGIDRDGDYHPIKPEGISISKMNGLRVFTDKHVTDEEIDESYRNGEIVIPNNFKKYVDVSTGKTYIIDSNARIAYSLYNRNAIRKYFSERFMEKLPTSDIHTTEDLRIRGYRIITL